MRARRGLISGAFLVVLASAAAAQDVPQLTVGRLTGEDAPQIDGRVDERAWALAEPFTGFIQQEPNEGQPATERTEVRFLIGRGTLYIAVICYDSTPGEIVVSESRRDAGLADTDSIEILLDTFNDGQNAFVFGTNPFGIELDGQVMGEGQTAAGGFMGSGIGGSQRGAFRGFNANWDADWAVRAGITERGWEAEFAIPLRTLRYNPGDERTWGVNVMRNIRRKNEQVFLSPVPRGYSLYRVSSAGKLNGLTLPARRDLRFIPYAAGAVNDDKTLRTGGVDRSGRLGLDVKWGVRADLTLDATINTDFAQVEADEEQVNLTRFALFFPEKRPFFLENAQLFQVGQPQAVDLFFSRRIGLDPSGQPIDIIGGARLSGKLGGGYNIGLLNLQTDEALDHRTGGRLAPGNNFTVVRLQRQVGRSNFGGIFVNRQGVGHLAPEDDFNRAYAVDAAWQATSNGRLFAFLARTDSPDRKGGSDYAGRVYYNYASPVWTTAFGYSQVGEQFNPEVGFLQRKAYRRVESRYVFQYQPQRWPSIRRFLSSLNYNVYLDLENQLESTFGHWHVFEIQPQRGGRITYSMDFGQDRPKRPFTVYQDVEGRRVIIPQGEYVSWNGGLEYISDPSAPVNVSFQSKNGRFYDGDHWGFEFLLGARAGARLLSSLGWNHDDIELPFGHFRNDLVPLNIGYSFTSLASLQGLIQYNRQSSTISSNVRLALLNRSGTGLFVVYNDRRDTSDLTSDTVLGRSFIVKYTRLLDF
ncbi:MAG: carbohydrate binding family 9 domain-containing protein [Acidobacteria bacterium]|nr:carbohydrate binding family 9 domain-containing protein [Acidobacteriota bacterium]